jgi:hypothetical protein
MGGYNTNIMPNNELETMLSKEFDRQVGNLIQKGYPKVAKVTAEEFTKHIKPLKDRVRELAAQVVEAKEGRIPFVIVVKSDLVPTGIAMPLVDLKGTRGYVGMYPVDSASFKPIEGLQIPNGMAYLLVDIDTGKGILNIKPDDALKIIQSENRSPLTIDEGVAVITHHPEILKNENCFSLLGSRRGDRRVTALWISRGKPRLGWCWAGNPHTWLGSASCSHRVGP